MRRGKCPSRGRPGRVAFIDVNPPEVFHVLRRDDCSADPGTPRLRRRGAGPGRRAVKNIGGHVEYDESDPGVVRRIAFDDKSKVAGKDMEVLKAFPQLRELRMGGSRVDDEGVSELGGLTRLETLDLSGTKVGDAGLASLKGLARLRSLDLKGTGVTDAGLTHLSGLPSARGARPERDEGHRRRVGRPGRPRQAQDPAA